MYTILQASILKHNKFVNLRINSSRFDNAYDLGKWWPIKRRLHIEVARRPTTWFLEARGTWRANHWWRILSMSKRSYIRTFYWRYWHWHEIEKWQIINLNTKVELTSCTTKNPLKKPKILEIKFVIWLIMIINKPKNIFYG